MTGSTSRREAERALVGALSRHIGYTAAASDLHRIFGILDLFAGNTSAYEGDLVSFLQLPPARPPKSRNGTRESGYIREVLSFAKAMGILETVSSKDVRMKRYAPTQVGRAMMGARGAGDSDFLAFFRTKLVLFADADALVAVLLLSQRGLSGRSLFAAYRRYLYDLRERRLAWLSAAFSDRRVFEHFVDRLPWASRRRQLLSSPQIERISEHTARHHVTPRKRWLVQLDLVESLGSELTRFGRDVFGTLLHNGEYFWLGPDSAVQGHLRIPVDKQRSGPFENTLAFRAEAKQPDAASVDRLVDETATLMIEAYPWARFIYSPQAPLVLPIEYIAYRGYADGAHYEWRHVLDLLFRRHRRSLERLSARRGPVGFYTVKQSV